MGPTGECLLTHRTQWELTLHGDVLFETLYLSIDPARRVWIGDNPGYVEPVAIGDVTRSGGIGRVVESCYDGLQLGGLVQGWLGWQSHPMLSD